MTLRARLVVVLLLVVLAPLLVGGGLLLHAVPERLQAVQAEALHRSTRQAAALLDVRCVRAGTAAQAVAHLAAGATRREQLQDAIEEVVRQGLASAVEVRDARGAVLAGQGTLRRPVGDCRAGESGASPVQARRVSLVGVDGEVGSVVAVVALDAQVLAALTGGDPTLQAAVVGRARAVLLGGMAPDLLARALAAPGPVRSGGRVAAAVRSGTLSVALAQPLSGPALPVPALAGLLVGAAVLAAGIAVVLARAFTRPLEELGRAADRIADGDLSTGLSARSRDEVGQLAGALARMTDRLRAHVRELEDSRDQLRAGLARLGDTLAGTHDVPAILGVVLDTALAATPATCGAVLLLAPDGDALEVAVSRGLPDLPVGARRPVAVGVAGRAALTAQPVRGRATAEGPGPAGHSALAVPLRGGGRLLGVVALYAPGHGPDAGFDDDDLARVRTLAGQAAVAVENARLHLDVQRMAVTDGLTGLGNRRMLNGVLAAETERAARYGRPLALLLLDLDRFKQVNDVHGHQRGDAVLVEFAERVRAQVRDVDTVARYGGEEVAVVLPETAAEGAAQAAERIWQAVRGLPFGREGETPLPVTVSIGVAVFPTDGATSEHLLSAADTALYAAKAAGRDGWRPAGVRRAAPGVGARAAD